MSLSVVIAGRQSQVVTPIGADIPVAILGNQLINPRSVLFKAILFIRTGSTEADFSDLVEFLRAEQDAVMASIPWGGTFGWNFDTNPVLDISAGSMGFDGSVDYSAYERQASPIPGTGGSSNLIYEDAIFNTAGGNVKNVFLGPSTKQARCSWALFQGSAEVKNNYEIINDTGILVPGSVTPYPPFPFTVVPPAVYDSPTSPSIQTVYKTLIPTKEDLRIAEANRFFLL